MSTRLCTGMLILLGAAGAAQAVPPPPPPELYTHSWRAMGMLDPYIGDWSGTETHHSAKWGDSERPVFWKIHRLDGKDVLLLEHGIGKSPPFTDVADIVTFDPVRQTFMAYLPGYRLFVASDQTSELVPADFDDDGEQLSWASTAKDGSKRRIHFAIEKGVLHETVETVSTTGVVMPVSDAVLTKGEPPIAGGAK